MTISPRHLLLIFAGVACFALGWYARSPTPPSYQPIVEIRERAAAAETVYVRDTIRFHHWKTRYDTVRSTLTLTDTVQVREYVRVADSTIFACHTALNSCTKALRLKDTLVREQVRYIERNHKPRTPIRDILMFGLGTGLGVALGSRR